jgi:CheY-like chemotaxis protein
MKKILLVEDDVNQRLLIKEELEERNYQVDEAGNGREALEKLQDSNPDLVLLDIRMPEMDGIEALGRLVEERKELKVILHTAYSKYKDNFLSWSADDYVIKSSDMEELLQKVKNILED